MLKMRAPGAKTFLQVIKARFGSRTHLVFCTFAFLTNLIVMMSLTIAGTAVLNRLSIVLDRLRYDVFAPVCFGVTFLIYYSLFVLINFDVHCDSLVDGLSPEMAAMLLACVIGGYTLIGGLGATFYVSYFNTALIFVLILMLVVEVRYIDRTETG